MDNLRQEKIQKYEEFVDKRLKPDLLHATAQRYSVYACGFYSWLLQIICINVCRKFECCFSIIIPKFSTSN